MLLGFIYARSASLLLLDEPDAHLHIILQKQMYDKLRHIARTKGCQLLIATHSEVLIDSTSPVNILSFFDHPHQLLHRTERDQVREALKRLTSVDLLLADQALGILYVEDVSDFNLLREWARILKHPSQAFFLQRPFWHPIHGRDPREARRHFFALQATKPTINGILLLDGDNRGLRPHELSGEGLEIVRWQRYEAESYLVHPPMLERFVKRLAPDKWETAMAYLQHQLPPAVYEDPLGEHDYLDVTPASKTLLPKFMEAADIALSKAEYYQIAMSMRPEEIPSEILEKLDLIQKMSGL
ncbi:MAG: AAA family ATPase [Chloroflexota bacterium]